MVIKPKPIPYIITRLDINNNFTLFEGAEYAYCDHDYDEFYNIVFTLLNVKNPVSKFYLAYYNRAERLSKYRYMFSAFRNVKYTLFPMSKIHDSHGHVFSLFHESRQDSPTCRY